MAGCKTQRQCRQLEGAELVSCHGSTVTGGQARWLNRAWAVVGHPLDDRQPGLEVPRHRVKRTELPASTQSTAKVTPEKTLEVDYVHQGAVQSKARWQAMNTVTEFSTQTCLSIFLPPELFCGTSAICPCTTSAPWENRGDGLDLSYLFNATLRKWALAAVMVIVFCFIANLTVKNWLDCSDGFFVVFFFLHFFFPLLTQLPMYFLSLSVCHHGNAEVQNSILHAALPADASRQCLISYKRAIFSPTHSALKHPKYRKRQFFFPDKHVHLDLDNSLGNNYRLFIDDVIYRGFIDQKGA